MQPPPGARKLINTHILEGAIRELAIPLIFDLCNLAHVINEDVDLAVNDLLFTDALYDVAGTQVHGDWVAGGSDFMMEALDLRKGSLEAVPLRFVSLAAFGYGDRVFEDGVVSP